MTKRGIAALACRLLGIYALLSSLSTLPLVYLPFVTTFTDPTSGGSGSTANFWLLVVNSVPTALQIMAGLYLWLSADTLAGHMVKDSDDAEGAQIVLGQEAQAIAFSALGLFTLLQVIPRIGQIVTRLFIINQDSLMRHDYSGMTAPDIVGIIIQVALGRWLLFGSADFVGWLRSLRRRDMDQEDFEGTQEA